MLAKYLRMAATENSVALYLGMSYYRFVTPSRSGKWYPSVEAAQQAAAWIGAGFWDELSRIFYPYRFTRLETRTAP